MTGAPGAGKTALLRALELEGVAVVEEAATDVIALEQARGVDAPWESPDFIDRVLALQQRREAVVDAQLTVLDRSPVCTLALARYLGRPISPALRSELERITRERPYDPRVLFVELLDRIEPTAARRITLEESRSFEAVHRQAYCQLGFDLVSLPPLPVDARVQSALLTLRSAPAPG